MAGQKRVIQKLDAFGDIDSGREDSTDSGGIASEGDNTSTEDVDDKTNTVSPPRSLFAPPLLPTLALLVPITSTPSFPPFNQRRPPVVMTPPSTMIETIAMVNEQVTGEREVVFPEMMGTKIVKLPS